MQMNKKVLTIYATGYILDTEVMQMNNSEVKELEYLTLRGEMAKRKISIENIASLLGIHRNSVANKLNGESSFSIEQAVLIQEAYFPDLSLRFLFATEGGE